MAAQNDETFALESLLLRPALLDQSSCRILECQDTIVLVYGSLRCRRRLFAASQFSAGLLLVSLVVVAPFIWSSFHSHDQANRDWTHTGAENSMQELLDLNCNSSTVGDTCFEAVVWAMNVGVYAEPSQYRNLTGNSSFRDFQHMFYRGNLHDCLAPCSLVDSQIEPASTGKRRDCQTNCESESVEALAARMNELPSHNLRKGNATQVANATLETTLSATATSLNMTDVDINVVGDANTTTTVTTTSSATTAASPQFLTVSRGTCAKAGLLPIMFSAMCEAAARMSGVPETSVRLTVDSDRPEGCYVFEHKLLWLNTNPHNHGNGADHVRQLLCMRHAPALEPSEFIAQDGAHIPVGAALHLYAVGSSNLVWMSWLDQFHLHLARLGYLLPVVPTKTILSRTHPRSVSTCDDSAYYMHLETARLGMVGWNSWDFAYRDFGDCDKDDFRRIDNHTVKCGVGPGCKGGRFLIRSSDIAEDASKSNVTVITTWYNDHKAFRTNYACFNGEALREERTSEVSIPTLQRLIREIHTKNPNVWVLVMGQYPATLNFKVVEKEVPWTRRLNMLVKQAVESEPRTLFVDYEIPGGGLEMYDRLHWGHPNCRGAKVIVHAALHRLYSAKVLSRGIKLVEPATNVVNAQCEDLHGASCSTSALCWVDPAENKCKTYSVGHKRFHRVSTSTSTSTSTSATTTTLAPFFYIPFFHIPVFSVPFLPNWR